MALLDKNLTKVPLTDVSSIQVDKALAKLQIVAPSKYDVDGKIELLRCSKVFNRYFAEYEDADIIVVFNNKGIFVDFESCDKKISCLFPKSRTGIVTYPCRVCAKEVTNKKDNSGYGLVCNGCGMDFHNSCTSNPMNVELYLALSTSPSYVKVLCPGCHLVHGSTELKLKRIDRKMKTLAEAVESVESTLETLADKPLQYSGALSKGMKGATINLPKKIVNGLAELTKATQGKEDQIRLKRTRIVARPGNTSIRTSKDIRREFNKNYTGYVIRNCRLTASGSIMFEFDDEESAKKVHSSWSDQSFGGNKGMKIPGESNTAGIIKYVYDDISENDIKEAIKSKCPAAECDFFKRRSDGKFNGMIKVDFKTRSDLLDAIDDKIVICSQRYIVEEYQRKSRVIKCNKCQGWGHIYRFCNNDPKCGKCADKHETSTCEITGGFKCAHCQEAHKAGSSECKVFKQKMAQFSSNRND